MGSWELYSQNRSTVTKFIIFGFPNLQGFQALLFWIFLTIYLLTVTGNGMILLLTNTDAKLMTPMYLFISHLSFLDMSYVTVTVPKMLAKFLMDNSDISFSGCFLQMYLFLSMAATECFLLAVMSFDRYYAICRPLHYHSRMTRKISIYLSTAAWTGGFLACFPLVVFASTLPFCGPNVIHHYYCDHPPLLQLACADTSLNVVLGSSIGFFVIISSFSLVVASYVQIILSILRIASPGGRRKAFSTCTSHLIVVNLFFLPLVFMYIRPTASYSPDTDSLIAMLYTVLTPMLNPLIYTLRNKDIRETFERKMAVFSTNISK
ncbi:olfactory receptor 6N1-like [Pleurodeles waltl]|uniref:olfactory receptor 6N1-like n=1 Tax=Pleurodeles waltl TaxID=8319 RepID=UPI00370939F1